MIPARLFKYQAFSRYALENVERSALWFSAPIKFNDPFDCALVIHRSQLTPQELEQVFHRERQRKGRLLTDRFPSGSQDPGFRAAIERGVNKSFDLQRERHLNQCGVSCFAERGDNLLMWAHYGLGHTGFCLEFDTSYEPFSLAYQVEYSDSVPQLSPVDLLSDALPQDHRYERAMLLTKSRCWDYEQEWRLIHAAADERIGYPPAALKGVYVGCNAEGSEVQSLVASSKHRGVATYRMERVVSDFALEPRGI